MDSTHMVQGLLHDMVRVDVSYIMPKLWILNELGYSYIPYTEYNIVESKNSPFFIISMLNYKLILQGQSRVE